MRWEVQWRSKNRLEGLTEHFIWDGARPLLFLTRREARAYIGSKWGYISTRPDLRAEPHGWRLPCPVRVEVILRDLA